MGTCNSCRFTSRLCRQPPFRRASGQAQSDGVQNNDMAADRDRDLQVFLASQFPVFVAVGALIPILPLFGQKFGLSQSSVGLLVSSPSIAKLVLNLPMGRLADTAGRRILMVSGMVLCAIADVGTGLAPTLPLLIFARLLLGAGLSSSDAGASAWVADATESRPDKRASFLGLQNAVIASAFVVGPAIGGKLVDEFGMSSIFYAVSVGAAICAAGYATLPELRLELPEGKQKQGATESLQELLASPEQQALAGVSVAFYCGAACKISLVPSIMSEVFAGSSSEVGQLFSALAALGILGTLLGGRLTDAVGPRGVLFACGAICAAAYCGAAVAVQAHAREPFFACLALWSLAASVKSPALQAFAIAAAPEDRRGAALSVPKTVGDVSYLLAPFVLGVVDDVVGPAAGLACCAATFAAGTVVFAAKANQADNGR